MGENAEIFQRLGAIEQTCARIDERTERHDKEHDDHEKRLRELEQENAKRKGIRVAKACGALVIATLWPLVAASLALSWRKSKAKEGA